VGFVLLLGLAPFGWLIARSSPESIGAMADDPAQEEHTPASQTLREVLSTRAFWVYTAAATVFNLVFSALTLDNELLLKEHGLDGADANKLILGVLMVSGLPANLVAGYLACRRPMGKLLAAGVVILALSLLVFPWVTTLAMAALYAALLGISGG